MNGNLTIKTLEESDLKGMFSAFMQAFHDYPIPFEMDLKGFRRKFVDKLNMRFDLSAGGFCKDKLVAFQFFSMSEYEGRMTAYNGGTGVIPEFRGQQLTSHLFNYLLPLFRARDITRSVLEVLTSNDKAIGIYRNLGYSITKRMKCFRLLPYRYDSPSYRLPDVIFREVNKPDWNTYNRFWDYSPSFLDSKSMLNHNIRNEVLIEACLLDDVVGYVIFQPDIGRISHIAIDHNHRRGKIGTMLIDYVYRNSRNKYLTAINIVEQASEIHDFLLSLGFENQLDQYEMDLQLV